MNASERPETGPVIAGVDGSANSAAAVLWAAAADSRAGALVDAPRGADLLVMGGGRAHHALGPALGRVTHAVLYQAALPVKLVPRPKRAGCLAQPLL